MASECEKLLAKWLFHSQMANKTALFPGLVIGQLSWPISLLRIIEFLTQKKAKLIVWVFSSILDIVEQYSRKKVSKKLKNAG